MRILIGLIIFIFLISVFIPLSEGYAGELTPLYVLAEDDHIVQKLYAAAKGRKQKKKQDKEQSERKEQAATSPALSVKLDLSSRYEDNVFNYSKNKRSQYNINSSAPKYKDIKSLDDSIITPSLKFKYRFGNKSSTEISMDISSSFYINNYHKNSQRLGLGLSGVLPTKSKLTVRYVYEPEHKTSVEYDEVIDEYIWVDYSRNEGSARLDHRLFGMLDLNIKGTYWENKYNADFEEKSMKGGRADIGMEFNLEKFEFGAGYGYEKGKQSDAAVYYYEVDIYDGVWSIYEEPFIGVNYRATYYSLDFGIKPTSRAKINLGADITDKKYTKGKPAGLRDRVFTYSADLTYMLSKVWETRVSYKFKLNEPTREDENREYRNNIYIVGISYKF